VDASPTPGTPGTMPPDIAAEIRPVDAAATSRMEIIVR